MLDTKFFSFQTPNLYSCWASILNEVGARINIIICQSIYSYPLFYPLWLNFNTTFETGRGVTFALAQENLCCAELSLSGILWDLSPVAVTSGSVNQCDPLIAQCQEGQECLEPSGSQGSPATFPTPALTVHMLYCELMHKPCLRRWWTKSLWLL